LRSINFCILGLGGVKQCQTHCRAVEKQQAVSDNRFFNNRGRLARLKAFS